MSVMQHNAFLVSSHERRAAEAYDFAVGLGMLVSPIAAIAADEVNSGHHFAVFSDGSKEGWPESDEGDRQRAEFRAWLHERPAYHWVEVSYGDLAPKVVDAHRYGDGDSSVDP